MTYLKTEKSGKFDILERFNRFFKVYESILPQVVCGGGKKKLRGQARRFSMDPAQKMKDGDNF